MDSLSLDSTRPSRIAEGESAATVPTGRATSALIVGPNHGLAGAYASFLREFRGVPATVVGLDGPPSPNGFPEHTLSASEWLRRTADGSLDTSLITTVLLFLDGDLGEPERAALEAVLNQSRRGALSFIGIISTFRVYLDDPNAESLERWTVERASMPGCRLVVFRPGLVLGPDTRMGRILKRLAAWYPLVPGWVRSCVVEEAALFEAVDHERADAEALGDRATCRTDALPGRILGRERREFALLGPNTHWREILREQGGGAAARQLMTPIARLLSWLQVGQLLALVLVLSSRFFPKLRAWHVPTLRPRSTRELISLCNPANTPHVKVVGYNNGVVHFGHRYPAKTIVSTVRCRQVRLDGAGRLKADCGATIRGALDELALHNRELYVVPNYSYVCVGTAFFVPIHGSAVDYSTVADTIEMVVLYDPDQDRIVRARRSDPDFQQHVYNLQARVVVLRAYLRTRPKSRYFVRRETVRNAEAQPLLDALNDRGAANVEIRQGHAASPTVTIARYFTDLDGSTAPALELPRDALGRLWDRLEENPLTSYLMHAVGRHLVWHAELFFNAEEFERFWRTHAQVPLRKIQLRAIRRDGLPHSPFRDEDCVSADLFMFRHRRSQFEAYLKSTFPNIRTNPGKHSN